MRFSRHSCCFKKRTNPVFVRHMPTLLIACSIVDLSAARNASKLRVPPSAARSFFTAASVTWSVVLDDNMRDTKVANRLFWNRPP
jgi:hypothetical protein